LVDVIVVPPVYEQCQAAVHSAFVLVEGVLQKDDGATPRCAHARKSLKRSGVGVGAHLVRRLAAEARWASVNVVARQIDAVQGRWLMRCQTAQISRRLLRSETRLAWRLGSASGRAVV